MKRKKLFVKPNIFLTDITVHSIFLRVIFNNFLDQFHNKVIILQRRVSRLTSIANPRIPFSIIILHTKYIGILLYCLEQYMIFIIRLSVDTIEIRINVHAFERRHLYFLRNATRLFNVIIFEFLLSEVMVRDV